MADSPGGGPGPRIAVFGDVIDDIIVTPRAPVRPDTDTPARIIRRPGGSAANAAAWLGSLGVSVEFFGHVGTADVSRHTLALKQHGVSPQLVGHDDLPTGTIVVLIDDARHTRTMLTERGANAETCPDDVTDDVLARVDHVHFTGYTVFARRDPAEFQNLMSRARNANVSVSVDPGSVGFLEDSGLEPFMAAVAGADILLPNLDEAVAIAGPGNPRDIARTLSDTFEVVAVTLGRLGAVAIAADTDVVEVAAVPATPKDTTGAGDAFCAGFLASWLTHRDVAAAAREGSRVAARAITVDGGRP